MNWESETTSSGCKNITYYEQFLIILKDKPTRGENILDLILDFCSKDHALSDVNTLWQEFTETLDKATSKYIPSKTARQKNGLPWVNRDIKRLIRSRNKLYKKHKQTGNPKDKQLFRELKHKVQQQIRAAYHHYIEEILGITTETGNISHSPTNTNVFYLYSFYQTRYVLLPCQNTQK